MTTLQLIFYQAHEIARREMACDAGQRYYGAYRAAFSDALRIIYSERGQDHDHDEVHRQSTPAGQTLRADRIAG